MATITSLPQAALLLAFDLASGEPRTHTSLARVVQAAAVGELVVGNRASLTGDKIQRVDQTPTGDRVSDLVLDRLSGSALLRNVLTAEDFAVKSGTRPEHIVREDLESLGYATAQKGGLLRRARVASTESSPAGELADQVALAVRGESEVDSRLAALIAVLDVFGYLGKVVGDNLVASHRQTVEHIVSRNAFGAALRRAFNDINVA